MSSMRAQCDAIPYYYDDLNPEDAANWPPDPLPTRGPRGSGVWGYGPALRAWRHGHGYYSHEVGLLFGVTGAAVRQWERERNAMPAGVPAYLWQHPVPPSCPDYPPTIEGLRRAISQWPSQEAWCRWWGPRFCFATLFRWLQGKYHIPLAVRVWLAAGAPLTWRGRPAPSKGRPPTPLALRTTVPADWIPLGTGQVAPPAGYCDPDRDALRLPGCAWCCYRAECADLQEGTP